MVKSIKIKINILDIAAFVYCSTLYDFWGNFKVFIELMCLSVFFIFYKNEILSFKIKKYNKYFIWLFSFFSICIASIIYAEYSKEAYYGARMFFETCLAGFFLFLYLIKGSNIIKFQQYLIFLSCVLMIKILITVPFELIISRELPGNLNSNSVGMRYAVCFITAFWQTKEKYLKRNSFVICSFLQLLGVILSGSKKAIFIIVFGLVMLLIIYQKNILGKLIYIFFGILFVIFFYLFIMRNNYLYSFIGKRIEGLVNALLYGYSSGDLSTRSRMNMITIAIREWFKKPLFGYGINNFGLYNKISEYGSINVYSHCNYTELLFGVGLVGTTCYYSIYSWLIKNQLRSFRYNNLQKYYLIIALMMVLLDVGMVSYIDEFMQTQIMLASASNFICEYYAFKKEIVC